LLPNARELIERAAEALSVGRTDDATTYLDLARLREPSADEQRQIEDLRDNF
jgi:hypothetical protein